MSFEPILAFLLIRYLRRSLKSNAINTWWDQIFTIALYGIVVLAIFQIAFHISPVVMWVWHALLLALVYLIYKDPVFDFAKKIMYAVLPLIILAFLSDLFKQINVSYFNQVENYIDFAFCVAFTWMIATIIRSNKQQKALDEERKKTQAEEEKSRFIATQKDELEVLVKERTSEILKQKEDLEHALTELRETQALLIQSEKMASLGELTAGIAHEIQNPLNFVNNFSEVNKELIEELQAESSKPMAERNVELSNEILSDIKQNLEKINHHGKRADAIVKGMLQHSRTNAGQKEPTDINALADEYLRLSYHGLRAKDKTFNAFMITDFDKTLSAGEDGSGKINMVPQDIGRVLLNLFNNAFYAVQEKLRLAPQQIGKHPYEPAVTVKTYQTSPADGKKAEVVIIVKDNGNGIPPKIMDKIFNPFFTTKPTGEGTGLGLSLSYDIIKSHGGTLKVRSVEGEFAEFQITLPR